MSKEQWRCKTCGKVQPVGNETCIHCSANLTLGGAEYVTDPIFKTGGQGRIPWVPIGLVTALIVALIVAAVLLIPKKSQEDPDPQPTTTSTEPTTEPTEHTTEPTESTTEPSAPPTVITGLSIDAYELPLGLSSRWIPVGYSFRYQLVPEYTGPAPADCSPTLTSSDQSILKIEGDRVIAVGTGEATLIARLGEWTDTLTVHVYPVQSSNSTLAISAAEKPRRDDGLREIEVTLTLDLEESGTAAVNYLMCEGVELLHSTDWVKDSDGNFKRTSLFTVDPEVMISEKQNIMVLCTVRTNEGSFAPAFDILGWAALAL